MGKWIHICTCSIIVGFSLFGHGGWAQGPGLNEEQQIRSRFIEACTEYMREEYDKAELIFNEIIERDKDNAASQFYLSKIHSIKGQNSSALTHIQRATQLEADNEVYLVFYRDLLMEMGSVGQAIQVQQDLTQQNPNDLALHMKELSLYTESQQWEDAQGKIEFIQDRFETGAALNEMRVQIFIALGEVDAAKSLLEQLVEEDPENTRYVESLNKLYRQTGEEGKSLTLLQESLGKDTKNPEAQWLLATQIWEKEDTTQFNSQVLPAFSHPAIPLSEKISLVQSAISNEQTFLSISLQQQLVEAIYKAHPDESGSLRLKGDMYFRAQAYDSAFSYYKNAIELDPSAVTVWEGLLASAEKGQQYEDLFWEAEEAISFFPNSAKLLVYYGIGAVKVNKWDQAEYAFGKIEKLPEISETEQAKYLQAWAYMVYQQESYALALEKIEKSQELYPQASGYELHGDILLKLGREKEALKQWELAIKNGAEDLNIQEKLTQ